MLKEYLMQNYKPTNQIIKENLTILDTETLISLHNQGDCYTDAAQQIIKNILESRSAMPVKQPTSQSTSKSSTRTFIILLMLITAAIISEVTKKYIINHNLTYPVLAVAVIYFLFKLSKKAPVTDMENDRIKDDDFIKNDNISEMMIKTAKGDIEGVREIIFRGGNVNKKSKSGLTAIMYAASDGNIEIAKLLLENGADPDIKTNKGRSAVSIAKKHEFHELLSLFDKYSPISQG